MNTHAVVYDTGFTHRSERGTLESDVRTLSCLVFEFRVGFEDRLLDRQSIGSERFELLFQRAEPLVEFTLLTRKAFGGRLQLLLARARLIHWKLNRNSPYYCIILIKIRGTGKERIILSTVLHAL